MVVAQKKSKICWDNWRLIRISRVEHTCSHRMRVTHVWLLGEKGKSFFFLLCWDCWRCRLSLNFYLVMYCANPKWWHKSQQYFEIIIVNHDVRIHHSNIYVRWWWWREQPATRTKSHLHSYEWWFSVFAENECNERNERLYKFSKNLKVNMH